MALNPFYLLFFLYLFSNIYQFIFGLLNGGFVISGTFQPISDSSYIIAFLFLGLVFVSVAFVFYIFGRVAKNWKSLFLGDGFGWFVIFIHLIYIYFALNYGLKVVGGNVDESKLGAIKYIFIALNPDFLGLVILPLLRNTRLFILGLLVFWVSFIVRGWMGGFFLCFLVFLIRFHPIKISFKSFSYCAGFLSCLVFLLPVLFSLKWGVRAGLSFEDIYHKIVSGYSLSFVRIAIELVVNRFAHVDNIAFLVDNNEMISRVYTSGGFRPFYANGIVYETLCRIFDSCNISLNRYMVREFYDYGALSWNVDPGLTGWFFVLGFQSFFYIGYWVICFFVLFFFVLPGLGNRAVLIFFVFFMTYAFHGWFGSFFDFMFNLVLVSAFFVCLKSLRKILNEPSYMRFASRVK